MPNLDRALSTASTERLTKTKKLYSRVALVTFVATPISALLGIWVDRRFFPTTLVLVFVWMVANGTVDKITDELVRRERADEETP